MRCDARSLKLCAGGQNKGWAWDNFLSASTLAQADNVRVQLQRDMERFDIDLVSIDEPSKLYKAIRMALVCGFFMGVAHREGKKGNLKYLTVKDNQARRAQSSLQCSEGF